jgi:hypothetical protein
MVLKKFQIKVFPKNDGKSRTIEILAADNKAAWGLFDIEGPNNKDTEFALIVGVK